jgi:hypothetical protein
MTPHPPRHTMAGRKKKRKNPREFYYFRLLTMLVF